MSSFSALRSNPNARRKILRAARMGLRQVPVAVKYEDAVGTLQAVNRYVTAFEAEQANIDFLRVLNTAWSARHE